MPSFENGHNILRKLIIRCATPTYNAFGNAKTASIVQAVNSKVIHKSLLLLYAVFQLRVVSGALSLTYLSWYGSRVRTFGVGGGHYVVNEASGLAVLRCPLRVAMPGAGLV
jgi:hypothetical protein